MRRNGNKNGWRRPTVARRRGDRLITLVCFTPLRDREASTIPFFPSPPREKGKPLFSLTRSGIALATYNAYVAPPLGTKASNKGALCKSSYLTVFPPHIRASLSNTYRIDAYCSTRRPFLMNRWTSFICVWVQGDTSGRGDARGEFIRIIRQDRRVIFRTSHSSPSRRLPNFVSIGFPFKRKKRKGKEHFQFWRGSICICGLLRP